MDGGSGVGVDTEVGGKRKRAMIAGLGENGTAAGDICARWLQERGLVALGCGML